MTIGEHVVTGGEASEADEIRDLKWDTYQTQAGQLYTMSDHDPVHDHEVCVGFIIEHLDGLAQAFLSTDPNKQGSALLVSPPDGTDIDTAIDALQGAYAAQRHEQA
jgi:hypothetical protein